MCERARPRRPLARPPRVGAGRRAVSNGKKLG